MSTDRLYDALREVRELRRAALRAERAVMAAIRYEEDRDLARFSAPSAEIASPAFMPCASEVEHNADPECATHECAIPEDRLERIADCGE